MAIRTYATANFIKRIIFSDCAVPFSIYLETFFPAALRYFFTTRLWLWDDVLRAVGTGVADSRKTGRGVRHGAKRKFQPSPLESREEYTSRRALQHVLYITEPLERIGFVLLVLGAADQFFYDWQAAIERVGPCGQPIGAGPLQRSLTNGFAHPLPNGGSILLPDIDQNRSGWATNPTSVNLPTGIYHLSFAARIVGPAGPPVAYSWRLEVSQGVVQFHLNSGDAQLGFNQEGDLVGSFDIFGSLVDETIVTWFIEGPAVPVGLVVKKARCTIIATG